MFVPHFSFFVYFIHMREEEKIPDSYDNANQTLKIFRNRALIMKVFLVLISSDNEKMQ